MQIFQNVAYGMAIFLLFINGVTAFKSVFIDEKISDRISAFIVFAITAFAEYGVVIRWFQ